MDKEAREYYFHRFYDFQPDLNMDNPDVRTEVRRIMAFWLQLGVAGFRMDAVPFVIESIIPGHKSKLHFEYLAEFRKFLQWRSADAILLGEANVLPPDHLKYFGENDDGIHMMFNFYVNQHVFYTLASADVAPLAKAHGSDAPAAEYRAVGQLPAQSRRARPGPLNRRAAAGRLRPLRSGQGDAALRPRHSPPACADARLEDR